MLKSQDKQKIVKEFGQSQKDTGSTTVQVALLTEKITKLTDHLKENKKDQSSKRGLIIAVGKRRGLLNYLKKKDKTQYGDTIKKLGLRK